MGNGVLHGAGALAKLMFSAFIVIAVFLITLLAGVIFAVPLFDMGFMELLNNLSNIGDPENTRLLKYFQMVQSIGLFVIPPFILAWFFGRSVISYLYLDKKTGWRTIILTTVIMLSAIPVINLIAHLNSQLTLPESWSALEEWMKRTEESAKQLTESFLAADDIGGLLFNLFLIAVIPAIGEELLFRGVIQRLFAEWTRNIHAGIWISAFLFSAMHMQFYGFLPRTMLGALFGYMLVWSGRMWVPVIAHFVNNAAAVIVYYYISKGQINESVETIGAERSDWLYAFVSLLFFLFFITVFYKRERAGYRYPGQI
jgi:uncharacterized protein